MDGYTTTQGASGYNATVTATLSAINANFGETQGAQGGSSSITGTVYSDVNDDSNDDSGDPGLAGWTVYIDVNGSGSYVSGDPTAVTDSNGTYTFTGLAAGTYTIGIVPQSGYTTTQGSSEWIVTTVAGQTSNGGSFGEAQPPGSIYGQVYDSRDNLGISDWYVYVDDTNFNQVASAYTDSYGDYSISDLTPGTYYVYAEQYRGWVPTYGSEGWTVVVSPGQDTYSGDFGER
jgi:hypothetical protein